MMEQLIADFPANITEALEIAKKSTFKAPKNDIRNIVICGLGGSGIGGKMVATWVEAELEVPVYFAQDYNLPKFVSEHTLVIASSYSGNTEETLSSLGQAIEKGAHVTAVCSGGRLQEICNENGFDCVVVPGGKPPRTALAFSLVQLLNILTHFNMIDGSQLSHIEKAQALIVENEAEIKSTAKELAAFLKGNVGILYSTTKYEPVLVRARQQFNENGKYLCWHHVIPEMNHNELVGWGGGDDRFAVVFFMTDDIHKRNQKRIEINKEVIAQKTSKMMDIQSKGDSIIERSLYMINIVDWASLYLSEMNEVDPVDIKVINHLKGELANFN